MQLLPVLLVIVIIEFIIKLIIKIKKKKANHFIVNNV
jgi:hypothetical protein